jgi:hypothetical protein
LWCTCLQPQLPLDNFQRIRLIYQGLAPFKFLYTQFCWLHEVGLWSGNCRLDALSKVVGSKFEGPRAFKGTINFCLVKGVSSDSSSKQGLPYQVIKLLWPFCSI